MKKILTNIKYLTLALVLILGVFTQIKEASAFMGGGVVTYANNLDIPYVVGDDNVPPTANAGADIHINLPTNSVTLPVGWAQAHDPNGDNTIGQTVWTLESGASMSITNGSTLTPTFTFSSAFTGIYTMRLTVTDNQGLTSYPQDTMQVEVHAAGGGGNPPTANAGPDLSITLPTNIVSVSGSGADLGGTIVSYAWTQVSGTAASITSPSTGSTNITGLTTTGVRVFRLTVTDNDGNSASDDMQVTVNPVGGGGGPPAPTTVGAVAGSCTSGRIDINWSASAGAASYNVRRSTTSGSGYSTIAGVFGLSHPDTNGLNPGTTYYYVIQGVDSGGTAGGNSVQASAVAPAATCPPVVGACSTPRHHYDCAVGTSPVGTQHASTGPSDPWTWYCVADTSSPLCSEPAGGSTRQCNDGLDNDKDGFVDFIGGILGGVSVAKDPQCTSATDNSERNLTEVEL